MPRLTNAFVATNGLNMLEEIRRERTVELAFEGYRRDDLRRWGTAETVLPLAIRGVKFAGTEYQQKFPELVIGQDIQVDSEDYIYEGRPNLYEKGGPTYLGGESHLNMNYLKFL